MPSEEALVLMNEMDLDKTNLADFLAKVLPPSGTTRPLEELMTLARATHPKFQDNPLVSMPVDQNAIYIVTSSPQLAKTGIICGLSMSMGVTFGMPSIVFVQNKTVELERFERSIDDYNLSYGRCADAVGCRKTRLKVFKLNDTRARKGFEKTLKQLKNGGSEFPVLLVMQNHHQLKKAKLVMGDIRKVFDPRGTDKGPIKCLVTFDEGDLVKKDLTNTWENQLHEPLGTQAFGAKSLLDSASSVAFVTATLHALVVSDLVSDLAKTGRAMKVCEVGVSSNYFGYAEGLEGPEGLKPVGFNKIFRKTGTLKDYLDFITDSSTPDAGMVYTSAKEESSKEARINAAKKTAVDYRGTRGLVTISWSSGELDVFTSSTDIQAVVERTEGFERVVIDHGVVQYTARALSRADITDYPSFITELTAGLEELNLNGFFKSILFGNEMVNRGVPICGLNHERHLDSMFADMPDSTYEHMIQVLGRLCAVQAVSTAAGVLKIMYAPPATNKRHIKAIHTVRYCINQFRKLSEGGHTLQAILSDLREKVAWADSGDVVVDSSGTVKFMKGKITRQGPKRDAQLMWGELEKTAKKSKVRILSEDSVALAEGAAGGHGQEAAPGTERKGSALESRGKKKSGPRIEGGFSIKDLVENHREDLFRAMTDVIGSEKYEGGVTLDEMKADISEASGYYPDGTRGQECELVDRIVSHELGALERAGIGYDTGVFYLEGE